jgi:hypothetical protein
MVMPPKLNNCDHNGNHHHHSRRKHTEFKTTQKDVHYIFFNKKLLCTMNTLHKAKL